MHVVNSERKLLRSTFQLDTPTWNNTGKHFWGHLLSVASKEVRAGFLRYIRFRGNKIAYLRHLGVHIGQDCDILNGIKDFGTEPWLIEIGQRVTVAQGVLFFTHDGANRIFRLAIQGSSPWGNRFGTIRILDNCFIGAHAIIQPDVQIGPDSIVGAGSVVTKDIPSQMVVAGTPAREICTLSEYIERYKCKMLPIRSTNRQDLREELTKMLWGEAR
jgi:acetyltransferase-like isoleucine patch superfamily enzyme